MTQQLDLFAVMDLDPSHEREELAIYEAIRQAALNGGGIVDRNTIAAHTPTWVGPNIRGAVIAGLINSRILTPGAGTTASTDTNGRNSGKLCRRYFADLPSLRRLVEETG